MFLNILFCFINLFKNILKKILISEIYFDRFTPTAEGLYKETSLGELINVWRSIQSAVAF